MNTAPNVPFPRSAWNHLRPIFKLEGLQALHHDLLHDLGESARDGRECVERIHVHLFMLVHGWPDVTTEELQADVGNLAAWLEVWPEVKAIYDWADATPWAVVRELLLTAVQEALGE